MVTVTTPLSGLAVPAQPLPAHVRGLGPVLAIPAVSISSTPPPYGAVAGSARSNSNLWSLTRSGSHRDSDRKNCSRCTAGRCAPATGSAPASAVSVLFRSRGASSPPGTPGTRRCASRPNRSSNRAAYCSSGPGATGHDRRPVITHPTAGQATPRHNLAYSKVNKPPLTSMNSQRSGRDLGSLLRMTGYPVNGVGRKVAASPAAANADADTVSSVTAANISPAVARTPKVTRADHPAIADRTNTSRHSPLWRGCSSAVDSCASPGSRCSDTVVIASPPSRKLHTVEITICIHQPERPRAALVGLKISTQIGASPRLPVVVDDYLAATRNKQVTDAA